MHDIQYITSLFSLRRSSSVMAMSGSRWETQHSYLAPRLPNSEKNSGIEKRSEARSQITSLQGEKLNVLLTITVEGGWVATPSNIGVKPSWFGRFRFRRGR